MKITLQYTYYLQEKIIKKMSIQLYKNWNKNLITQFMSITDDIMMSLLIISNCNKQKYLIYEINKKLPENLRR